MKAENDTAAGKLCVAGLESKLNLILQAQCLQIHSFMYSDRGENSLPQRTSAANRTNRHRTAQVENRFGM